MSCHAGGGGGTWERQPILSSYQGRGLHHLRRDGGERLASGAQARTPSNIPIARRCACRTRCRSAIAASSRWIWRSAPDASRASAPARSIASSSCCEKNAQTRGHGHLAVRHRHGEVHVLRPVQRAVSDRRDPSYDRVRGRGLFAGKPDSPLRARSRWWRTSPRRAPSPIAHVGQMLERGMRYVDEWAQPGGAKPPAAPATAASAAAAGATAAKPAVAACGGQARSARGRAPVLRRRSRPQHRRRMATAPATAGSAVRWRGRNPAGAKAESTEAPPDGGAAPTTPALARPSRSRRSPRRPAQSRPPYDQLARSANNLLRAGGDYRRSPRWSRSRATSSTRRSL